MRQNVDVSYFFLVNIVDLLAKMKCGLSFL